MGFVFVFLGVDLGSLPWNFLLGSLNFDVCVFLDFLWVNPHVEAALRGSLRGRSKMRGENYSD